MIVRDARSRPLRRVVISVEGRMVDVAALDRLKSIKSGATSPIGFDKIDDLSDTYRSQAPIPEWHQLQSFEPRSRMGIGRTMFTNVPGAPLDRK